MFWLALVSQISTAQATELCEFLAQTSGWALSEYPDDAKAGPDPVHAGYVTLKEIPPRFSCGLEEASRRVICGTVGGADEVAATMKAVEACLGPEWRRVDASDVSALWRTDGDPYVAILFSAPSEGGFGLGIAPFSDAPPATEARLGTFPWPPANERPVVSRADAPALFAGCQATAPWRDAVAMECADGGNVFWTENRVYPGWNAPGLLEDLTKVPFMTQGVTDAGGDVSAAGALGSVAIGRPDVLRMVVTRQVQGDDTTWLKRYDYVRTLGLPPIGDIFSPWLPVGWRGRSLEIPEGCVPLAVDGSLRIACGVDYLAVLHVPGKTPEELFVQSLASVKALAKERGLDMKVTLRKCKIDGEKTLCREDIVKAGPEETPYTLEAVVKSESGSDMVACA